MERRSQWLADVVSVPNTGVLRLLWGQGGHIGFPTDNFGSARVHSVIALFLADAESVGKRPYVRDTPHVSEGDLLERHARACKPPLERGLALSEFSDPRGSLCVCQLGQKSDSRGGAVLPNSSAPVWPLAFAGFPS